MSVENGKFWAFFNIAGVFVFLCLLWTSFHRFICPSFLWIPVYVFVHFSIELFAFLYYFFGVYVLNTNLSMKCTTVYSLQLACLFTFLGFLMNRNSFHRVRFVSLFSLLDCTFYILVKKYIISSGHLYIPGNRTVACHNRHAWIFLMSQ